MLLPSCAFVVRNVHLCQSLPPVGAQIIIPAGPVLPPDQGPVDCKRQTLQTPGAAAAAAASSKRSVLLSAAQRLIHAWAETLLP